MSAAARHERESSRHRRRRGCSAASRRRPRARARGAPRPVRPARRARARDELIALVERRSGLRGRGGAGFPTATKLAAVAAQRGRPIVVANGAEGEPPSRQGQGAARATCPTSCSTAPSLAARAVGAQRGRSSPSAPIGGAAGAHALAERRAAGADRGLTLRVVAVPDRFVAGEETALVHFLNGGPALPTFTPPRPFERGVGGAPTLVQNVETLAQLALDRALRRRLVPRRRHRRRAGHGARHALRRGRSARASTRSRSARRSQQLVDRRRRATGAASQAFLVGGYFGTWIAGRDRGRRLSDATSRRYGAALGARAIVALAATACGVAETARVARYLADESAGQCGPCVHGLDAVADGLEQLLRRGRDTSTTASSGAGSRRSPAAARAAIPTAPSSSSRARSRLRSASSSGTSHGRCTGARRQRPADPVERDAMSDAFASTRSPATAHGLCAELFPERIELDEWGYPIVDRRRFRRSSRSTRAVRSPRARPSRSCSSSGRRRPAEGEGTPPSSATGPDTTRVDQWARRASSSSTSRDVDARDGEQDVEVEEHVGCLLDEPPVAAPSRRSPPRPPPRRASARRARCRRRRATRRTSPPGRSRTRSTTVRHSAGAKQESRAGVARRPARDDAHEQRVAVAVVAQLLDGEHVARTSRPSSTAARASGSRTMPRRSPASAAAPRRPSTRA